MTCLAVQNQALSFHRVHDPILIALELDFKVSSKAIDGSEGNFRNVLVTYDFLLVHTQLAGGTLYKQR